MVYQGTKVFFVGFAADSYRERLPPMGGGQTGGDGDDGDDDNEYLEMIIKIWPIWKMLSLGVKRRLFLDPHCTTDGSKPNLRKGKLH